MHDIHLIEKTMSFRQADDGSGDWITGDWRLFPSEIEKITGGNVLLHQTCLLYTSPSPRDRG